MAEAYAIEVNRQQIRTELSNVLNSTIQLLQGSIDENILDGIEQRLDWIYNIVVRYVDSQILDERVVNCIQLAKECMRRNTENLRMMTAERIFSGQRGRPRFEIPFEQLQFLTEKKFKVAEIAELFGTSKRTVERKMNEYGLSAASSYSTLSDDQLDSVISTIQKDFPNVGSKRMTGLLRSRGVFVQQTRIRQSIRRVDPEGTLLRALEMRIISRRQYCVAGPLSLWHIDGNHKLIR